MIRNGVGPPPHQKHISDMSVGSKLYIYIYITTQCKLPGCKCSICASGWMKKHHQRKLQRVMLPRVQVDYLR